MKKEFFKRGGTEDKYWKPLFQHQKNQWPKGTPESQEFKNKMKECKRENENDVTNIFKSMDCL
jgi:hypothetical protein